MQTATPYPPELYELLHQGNPGDVERYADLLEAGSRVLELGCGQGRVSIAFAELGHDVTGLEIDPRFLERARAKTAASSLEPTWVLGDMRDFSLDRRFDAVVASFNTLYCEADLEACLRSVGRHLSAGGRLLFDVYDVEDFHELAQDDEDIFETVAVIELDGERIEVAERALWDKPGQRLDVDYRHRWSDAPPERLCGPTTKRSEASPDSLALPLTRHRTTRRREEVYRITHYYRTQAQLRELLEASGFELESIEPLMPEREDGGSSILITALLNDEA